MTVWPTNLLTRLDFTDSGCVEFTGSRDRHGYGRVWNPSLGRPQLVHRAMWELMHEVTLAPAEVLDHLCVNPPCVNLAHLEVVTQSENAKRQGRRRTTCPQGHPWDEKNTYRDKVGARHCRRCGAERAAARRKEKARG